MKATWQSLLLSFSLAFFSGCGNSPLGVSQSSNLSEGSGNQAGSSSGGGNNGDQVDDTEAAPTVISVSPTSGALAGGNQVQVYGTNFDSSSQVTFGGLAATGVTLVSPTQLNVIAPAAVFAGTATVSVTNATGSIGTLSNGGYQYESTPAATQSNPPSTPPVVANISISSISPSAALTVGGNQITIHGAQFGSSAIVTIGGSNCPVTGISSTSISCTAPAGAAGGTTVTVTTSGQTQSAVYNYALPIAAGLFWSGTGGYYANAVGHYCLVDSWPQWLAMGGPSGGGSAVPNYPTIPDYLISDGQCWLPAGFFAYGTGGYWSNGQGGYCLYESWGQWLAAGGPSGGAAAVPNYEIIPNSMSNGGFCGIPAGFFWSGTGGYYSNGQGGYCVFTSWQQWIATGGPAGGAGAVVNYGVIPPVMASGGTCSLPTGCFFSGPTGYYSNGLDHICAFSSWDMWLQAGCPANAADAPNYPNIPSGETLDGNCSI